MQIKHCITGKVLFERDAENIKLCVEAAVESRADLSGADLSRAYLSRADLSRAYLSRAYLIDGGQERRGYCFWAWRHADGYVVYRGGCHEWASLNAALQHYSETYRNGGNRHECAARLRFLHEEAVRRGWIEAVAGINSGYAEGLREGARIRAALLEALEAIAQHGGMTKLHPDETASAKEQYAYSEGASAANTDIALFARAAIALATEEGQ